MSLEDVEQCKLLRQIAENTATIAAAKPAARRSPLVETPSKLAIVLLICCGCLTILAIAHTTWVMLGWEAIVNDTRPIGVEKHLEATLGFVAWSGIGWGCLFAGFLAIGERLNATVSEEQEGK